MIISLFDVCPNSIRFHSATSMKFLAKQVILENEFTTWDLNLSDGCSCELELPLIGIYEITAYSYDEEENQLDDYLIISQMLIILL